MTVGEKIRKYRQIRGLSQKELAGLVRMSEPAIRNYELGNRTPNESQLTSIANALGISVYCISDPTFENAYGIMHALFELEESHNLTLIREKGNTYMTFKSEHDSIMAQMLEHWGDANQKMISGEITLEEYKEWKTSYPKNVVKDK